MLDGGAPVAVDDSDIGDHDRLRAGPVRGQSHENHAQTAAHYLGFRIRLPPSSALHDPFPHDYWNSSDLFVWGRTMNTLRAPRPPGPAACSRPDDSQNRRPPRAVVPHFCPISVAISRVALVILVRRLDLCGATAFFAAHSPRLPEALGLGPSPNLRPDFSELCPSWGWRPSDRSVQTSLAMITGID